MPKLKPPPIPEQINARVSPELAREIEKYARANRTSKSGYGALIYQWWMEQGCPPVGDADRKAREEAAILERVKNPETRKGLLKQLSYAAR